MELIVAKRRNIPRPESEGLLYPLVVRSKEYCETGPSGGLKDSAKV